MSEFKMWFRTGGWDSEQAAVTVTHSSGFLMLQSLQIELSRNPACLYQDKNKTLCFCHFSNPTEPSSAPSNPPPFGSLSTSVGPSLSPCFSLSLHLSRPLPQGRSKPRLEALLPLCVLCYFCLGPLCAANQPWGHAQPRVCVCECVCVCVSVSLALIT